MEYLTGRSTFQYGVFQLFQQLSILRDEPLMLGVKPWRRPKKRRRLGKRLGFPNQS